MTINNMKKTRQTTYKTSSVLRRYCQDCPDSKIHQTGSQLWVSCKFVSGWRSINSECSLPFSEQKRRTEK